MIMLDPASGGVDGEFFPAFNVGRARAQLSAWSMTMTRSSGTPALSSASARTATSGSSLTSWPSSMTASPAPASASASWYFTSPQMRQSTPWASAARPSEPAEPVAVAAVRTGASKSPHTRGWRPKTDVQRAARRPSVSGSSPAARTAHTWP